LARLLPDNIFVGCNPFPYYLAGTYNLFDYLIPEFFQEMKLIKIFLNPFLRMENIIKI